MDKSKDRYQEIEQQIIFNVTGMSKRHIIFLQLIAEYDLSCLAVQKNIIEALDSKHAMPLDHPSIRINEDDYSLYDLSDKKEGKSCR